MCLSVDSRRDVDLADLEVDQVIAQLLALPRFRILVGIAPGATDNTKSQDEPPHTRLLMTVDDVPHERRSIASTTIKKKRRTAQARSEVFRCPKFWTSIRTRGVTPTMCIYVDGKEADLEISPTPVFPRRPEREALFLREHERDERLVDNATFEEITVDPDALVSVHGLAIVESATSMRLVADGEKPIVIGVPRRNTVTRD